ncbi:MAG: prepilin-type N-terminal cleavage/methylation domain-containing protein [Candidatus Saganbacteria bacterium]|nr:prepilin-type N-terminal cleavage/methylation domain-containing protein [Candidatus Saganbacteria bacterium]
MKKGFTLIEVLISMALTMIVLGSAFFATSTFLRTWRSGTASLEALQGGRIVLQRITDEVRNSRKIDPSSNPSQLISNFDGYNIAYDLKDGKIRREKGGGSSYLTEEGIVTSLNFSYPSQKLVEVKIGVEKKEFAAKAFVRN